MGNHVSVETSVIPSNEAPSGGRDPVASWPGANTGVDRRRLRFTPDEMVHVVGGSIGWFRCWECMFQ